MNAVADAAAASAERLKLTEIFLSLQGEARDAGWPTVFVRLTGCPLRCQYCDTAAKAKFAPGAIQRFTLIGPNCPGVITPGPKTGAGTSGSDPYTNRCANSAN